MLNQKEKDDLKEEYYPKQTAMAVLGCLLQDNELLGDREKPLSEEDFIEPFHKYIFKGIYNLTLDGVKDIGALEIKKYLNRVSEKAHRIVFEINDGLTVIENTKAHSKMNNYDYNYIRLRKFGMLRDMIDEDVDVTAVLDKTGKLSREECREQEQAFDEWSLEEMVDETLEYKALRLREKYCQHGDGEYKKIGDNAEKIKENLRKGLSFGLLGRGKFKNTVTRGANRGKFHLHSANSGVGKSRLALEELVTLVAPELWSHDKKMFVPNPNNPLNELSAVYVGTELDLEDEVEIILWATISGIETDDIKDINNLSDEMMERLDHSIEIAKRTKIYNYLKPNYDIKSLERIVRKHQKEDNVFALAVDYIEKTANIVKEYLETFHTKFAQGHEVYSHMSNMFKTRLAGGLNIYVTSSTQLNAKSETRDISVGAGMIKGSYGLVNKVDFATITMEITQSELEIYNEFLHSLKGLINTPEPNLVEHGFKNRGGKISKFKIFKYVNRGHMETYDLMITDEYYKVLNIDETMAESLSYEQLEEMKQNSDDAIERTKKEREKENVE